MDSLIDILTRKQPQDPSYLAAMLKDERTPAERMEDLRRAELWRKFHERSKSLTTSQLERIVMIAMEEEFANDLRKKL